MNINMNIRITLIGIISLLMSASCSIKEIRDWDVDVNKEGYRCVILDLSLVNRDEVTNAKYWVYDNTNSKIVASDNINSEYFNKDYLTIEFNEKNSSSFSLYLWGNALSSSVETESETLPCILFPEGSGIEEFYLYSTNIEFAAGTGTVLRNVSFRQHFTDLNIKLVYSQDSRSSIDIDNLNVRVKSSSSGYFVDGSLKGNYHSFLVAGEKDSEKRTLSYYFPLPFQYDITNLNLDFLEISSSKDEETVKFSYPLGTTLKEFNIYSDNSTTISLNIDIVSLQIQIQIQDWVYEDKIIKLD